MTKLVPKIRMSKGLLLNCFRLARREYDAIALAPWLEAKPGTAHKQQVDMSCSTNLALCRLVNCKDEIASGQGC